MVLLQKSTIYLLGEIAVTDPNHRAKKTVRLQPFSKGVRPRMNLVSGLKQRILPLRQQAALTNRWLKHRLENVLPDLMNREELDLWVVIAREYNEDPVLLSLLPEPMLSARRRTILVFRRLASGQVERWNFGRAEPGLDTMYQGCWDKAKEDQWVCLARHIKEWDPQAIGINVSDTFAFGDGLSKSQYDQFVAELDSLYVERLVSAQRVAVGWLETRTQDEIHAYAAINALVHDMIAEAYSRNVIHPGVTTADDVAWWFRQTMTDIGLQAWFQPTVMIQRRGRASVPSHSTILPGDLLHCDVGLHYLGLATDTQQMAYVPELGETEPPDGLKTALTKGNQLQDIFTAEFVAGHTGNDVFLKALEAAQQHNLQAMIYTHPIGYHGHGAGPTMGLFDQQKFVKGSGEYELHDDTCYAVELNVMETIREWDNQKVMIALEQTAVFTNGCVRYLGGRQTQLHIVD